MNDPTRWRDGAEDLPDDVRASLRGAHGPSRPNAGERAAMVAFASKLGAVPPASLHPLARLGGWKVVGLAGLVAAVGATTIPILRHRGDLRAASVASAHVSTVAAPVVATPVATGAGGGAAIETPVVAAAPTVAEAVHEAPAMVPGPARTVAVAPPVRANARPHIAVNTTSETARPAAPACPVALGGAPDEERVIRAAASALGSDPAVTLACVRELSAHGGPSQLRDEYWFLGFEASRRLGHTADARQWGQALLQGASDSPYAARVRQWIAGTSGQ